jgi:inosine-uridine nucleoside N-ribohydrolase
MAHAFSRPLLERFFALGTRRAEFFRRSNLRVIEYVTKVLGRQMLFAPDGLAMAVALEPDIVARSETHAVSIELNGRHTRGQTTVDWMDRSGRPASVEVILEVSQPRFVELMELGLR